ncbi:nucleotidyl transferase AbiEii/AbiGii toxin family protein [Flavobacterium yafengii]|uniref:nucleotidyl transferase AbiEii/AbiGii toxin family protein n=1 Tax=Flavobacterium yafengii TaxID=3041253 RepID=UPI0024A9C62F|nr:nucleotidyl transferase AbiEii/AbiGii toxin family protein [Flavobacterium yafengii]MDI6046208.1 nucleotidyltransferase [Flavobacterium yafengii]
MQSTQWDNEITLFIELSNRHKVRMIMVGGGAVNFHGYQRHSADVDFWIETTDENFKKLVLVFNEMGYEITDFPNDVKQQLQNISVKFSPANVELELITNFSSTKPFNEAYERSEIAVVNGKEHLKWNVLSYEDLIDSKIKASRPKDLLDIAQLQKNKEVNKIISSKKRRGKGI